jgi:hypothetical protein
MAFGGVWLAFEWLFPKATQKPRGVTPKATEISSPAKFQKPGICQHCFKAACSSAALTFYVDSVADYPLIEHSLTR